MMLEGEVKKVIFANEESGFIVFLLETDEKEDIAVTGEFAGLGEGDFVRVEGEFGLHPAYGRRFEAKMVERILPHKRDGIIRYLSSGRIPGIGEARARKIVKTLGEDCLNIIASDPNSILKVKGIGKKRACEVAEKIKSELELAKFSSMLIPFGITPKIAFKIYQGFGPDGMEKIKSNPYILTEIPGIGFKQADKIAEKFCVPKDLPSRIQSGVIYLIDEALGNGNTYIPYEELIDDAARILGVEKNKIKLEIEECAREGKIVVDGDKVYLKRMYDEERICAELIVMLSKGVPIGVDVSEKEIDAAGKELGIEFTDEQKEAIRGALVNKVSIITGGPGTGKTTILRGLLRILNSRGIRVDLAAPTGRASRRITELTGFPALTIHRLLEYNPQMKMFRRSEFFPLDGDFVIIDEMSMVDISLFLSLLRAVYKDAHLVLIGDADQLPSVGPGRVLLDLVESSIFPVFRLKKIHRQAEKSLIVVNAHRIRNGIDPIIRNSRDSDFFFLKEDDPEKGANIIVDLVCRRLPSSMGFDPFSELQVLTPMYKGETGAHILNSRLQNMLNPNSPGLKHGKFEFRVGDRVMQTKNNYDKGVFNGELGIIKDISFDDGTVFVMFEHLVPYRSEELDELSLAYAITVHKSQGNEYPVVIIPLFTEHFIMLARNLLYTALTRAKKLVVIVGSYKALARAVRNEKMIDRYSGLIDKLKRFKG